MKAKPLFRLPSGGKINRDEPINFFFNRKKYQGFKGDTLASALLANGVRVLARSFKYHRARGIFSAGVEEPNALIALESGNKFEPNVPATRIWIYEGLVASSQNCWPSVDADIGALIGFGSKILPAGFYYKTFMWPRGTKWWLRYERLIRRAAGIGHSGSVPDADTYEHQYLHCDILIIGGGPAGIATANAMLGSEAAVILCDENPELGGICMRYASHSRNDPAVQRIGQAIEDLSSGKNIKILTNTTAFGWYDHNLIGLIQRNIEGTLSEGAILPAQRVFFVRAKKIIVATGAIERPLPYINNDLPGTMLAGSVRVYLNQFAVRPGNRAVVFTNNDTAYHTALELADASVHVAAIVDSRPLDKVDSELVSRVSMSGLRIISEAVIGRAFGRTCVRSVELEDLEGHRIEKIVCDLVCVSGGWTPTVHLLSHARVELTYSKDHRALLPCRTGSNIVGVGAVSGVTNLNRALADGHKIGASTIASLGFCHSSVSLNVPGLPLISGVGFQNSLHWRQGKNRGKTFVDLQNDVTTADIRLAIREGYSSVEHVKRYTTLGMGLDQGKTSNALGFELIAAESGVPIPQVGTTTFRPPYAPVTLGALVGHEVGVDLVPVRETALHEWHAANGARFVETSGWKRPHSYPRKGETEEDAAAREASNVRKNVGIVDVSTLGKIELQGKDSLIFLNRIYANSFDSLKINYCRYGIMLREDGTLLDDGTVCRLGETRYLITTTTVNAVRIMDRIDRFLQVVWPELDVYAASVTERWSAFAVAGPRSRELLGTLLDIDISNESFPFLALNECNILVGLNKIPVRVMRISFSGELAYEIHVDVRKSADVWQTIVGEGGRFGLMPYGVEAMGTLRIEKGHVVIGAEANGRTTAADLGLGALINKNKWCVGKRMHQHSVHADPDRRLQLVGVMATSLDRAFPKGAVLIDNFGPNSTSNLIGHLTAWCWSPNLAKLVGLALMENGHSRAGEHIRAASPLTGEYIPVVVQKPCFIDPDGARLRK